MAGQMDFRTGDNRYKLYVNEQLVSTGPVKLTSGKNNLTL